MKYAAHEAGRIHTWVFDQDKVWVDRYGNEHNLADMNVEYLYSVVDFLFKNAQRFACVWSEKRAPQTPYEDDFATAGQHAVAEKNGRLFMSQRPLMRALYAEIEKRETPSVPSGTINAKFDIDLVTRPSYAFTTPAEEARMREEFHAKYVGRPNEFVALPLTPMPNLTEVARRFLGSRVDRSAPGVARQLAEFRPDDA